MPRTTSGCCRSQALNPAARSAAVCDQRGRRQAQRHRHRRQRNASHRGATRPTAPRAMVRCNKMSRFAYVAALPSPICRGRANPIWLTFRIRDDRGRKRFTAAAEPLI
jgi:hypothetical protein